MVKDSVTRRGALAGLAVAGIAPHEHVGQLATATALAGSNFYGSKAYGGPLLAIAAGEAGTAPGGLFSIDDGAGTLVYFSRTEMGSAEIARTVTPSSLSATTAATQIGSENGNVQSELDGKAGSTTKSTAVGAAPYPVDHRMGRDHPPHPFEFITNAATQNAIIAGTSLTDVSSELRAMASGWNPSGGKAGIIDFPNGRYALGEPILWPNWINWRGGTGRGHQLLLLADHTGPYAFQFDSDPLKLFNGPDYPSSQFQQRLIGFDINCNSAPNIKSVIYAPSWNEKCGLSHCIMRNIPAKAFLANEFHGGSAGYQLLDNCELFFDSTATIGIDLIGKRRDGTLILNKPIITINNTSIVGGVASTPDTTNGFIMFNVDNVHLNLCGGVHLEKAWIGFYLSNGATLTGSGLTGSDNGGRIKEIVARAANHTGFIDLSGIENGSSSGTRVLFDEKTGIHASEPLLGSLQVPSRPGSAWASGSFQTSGGEIIGTPELIRCLSVTREANGYYRVVFSNSMVDGKNYTVGVLPVSDTDCRAHVRDSERTDSHFYIRVYRISDNTLFDPGTVTFEVNRRPGL